MRLLLCVLLGLLPAALCSGVAEEVTQAEGAKMDFAEHVIDIAGSKAAGDNADEIAGRMAELGRAVAKADDAAIEAFQAPQPVNSDLEIAKKSLQAARDFANIFNSQLFEVYNIKAIAEVVTKVFDFALSIVNLLMGGPQESAEMKFMREQFSQVNSKLDSIQLQLDDVKRLIAWQSARVMYAHCETFIMATASLLNGYASAAPANRAVARSKFVAAYRTNPLAHIKLYQAIMSADFVISTNLAAAVVHYTRNHRRYVTNFLLGMQRLIMKGATLEIAHDRITHGAAVAAKTKGLWQWRLQQLVNKMHQVITGVKNRYHAQMVADLEGIIINGRGLSNQDFSGHMYRNLANKFDWLLWFSLTYNDVSGGDKHWVSFCGGDVRFRTPHGNRNVVVASSNPRTSRFTQARGNAWLDAAQRDGAGSHAEAWTNLIRSKTGNYCDDAAFVGSVCWGCNVWFTMRSDRYVYRKMSNRGDINTIIFG